MKHFIRNKHAEWISCYHNNIAFILRKAKEKGGNLFDLWALPITGADCIFYTIVIINLYIDWWRKKVSVIHLPTTRSSPSEDPGCKRFHISMVKSVLALLNTDVRELIRAAIMAANISPFRPDDKIGRELREVILWQRYCKIYVRAFLNIYECIV